MGMSGKNTILLQSKVTDIARMALNLKPLTPDEPKSPKDDLQVRDFLYSRKEAITRIKSKQRVYGVHGASLTWGIGGNMSNAVKAGGEGEKQVGKLLDAYAEKHSNVFVFHSVQWPGSKGDTDHMIVCGRLMLIIDAKRWKSKRKYSVTPKGAILRGTVPFPEGKVKMMPAMAAWRKELGSSTKVMGVVCIAQEEVFVPYDKNWHSAPYRLVTAEKLEEYLDRIFEKTKSAQSKVEGKTLLNIAEKVIKPRDRINEIINTSLMNSF